MPQAADQEKKTVVPLESGIEKVEKAVGVENIYDAVSTNYVHQLTKALTAKKVHSTPRRSASMESISSVPRQAHPRPRPSLRSPAHGLARDPVDTIVVNRS